MSAGVGRNRIERDVMKLMRSKHDVEIDDNDMSKFQVRLHGPTGTPYEKGIWDVRVELVEEYPYKSPSVKFLNPIIHRMLFDDNQEKKNWKTNAIRLANIDLNSGSVCLDVINQTWTPMYDLNNVFDVFLPQLLAYPNPHDPLNSEAASMLRSDPQAFEKTVRDHIQKHIGKETATVSMDPSEAHQEITNSGKDKTIHEDDKDIEDEFSDYEPSDEELI